MLGQIEAFCPALGFIQIQVFAAIPETDRFNRFRQNKLLCSNAELPKELEEGTVWFLGFGITTIVTDFFFLTMENLKYLFKEETKLQKTLFFS